MTDRETLIELCKRNAEASTKVKLMLATPLHALTWEELVDIDLAHRQAVLDQRKARAEYESAMDEALRSRTEERKP